MLHFKLKIRRKSFFGRARPGSARTRCGSIQRFPDPLAGLRGTGGRVGKEKKGGERGSWREREGRGREG